MILIGQKIYKYCGCLCKNCTESQKSDVENANDLEKMHNLEIVNMQRTEIYWNGFEAVIWGEINKIQCLNKMCIISNKPYSA